jgi:hypothetical protein
VATEYRRRGVGDQAYRLAVELSQVDERKATTNGILPVLGTNGDATSEINWLIAGQKVL